MAHETCNLKEARILYQESLEINQDLGFEIGVASNLGQLGRIAESENAFMDALIFWMKALIISDKLDLPYKETIYKDLARIATKLGEDKFNSLAGQLSTVYPQATRIFDYIKVETESQKAEELISQKRWLEAYQILKSNKNIYRTISDRKGFAKTLLYLAQAEQEIGDLEKARWTYKDALEQFKGINPRGYAVTSVYLGRLELQTGFIKDAITHLKDAKKYFLTYKNESNLAIVDKLLEAADRLYSKQREDESWARGLFDKCEKKDNDNNS